MNVIEAIDVLMIVNSVNVLIVEIELVAVAVAMEIVFTLTILGQKTRTFGFKDRIVIHEVSQAQMRVVNSPLLKCPSDHLK